MHKYDDLLSIVILDCKVGFTATIRCKNKYDDRIMSAPTKEGIYTLIDRYMGV